MMTQRTHADQESGFTLIELLVVIVIVGLLTAIAVPVFLNQRNKGYDAQAKSDVHDIATLEQAYYADNDSYLAGGSASNTTALKAQLTDYRPSTDVMAAQVVAPTGNDWFCVRVTSRSNRTFFWDSATGQLSQNAAC